jgi:hypothetical protein
MATDPWYLDSEEEKVKRRQAADDFLTDVLNDTAANGLYDQVVADHTVAGAKFAEKYKAVTGLDLPKPVVVACKVATTETAANIVLFHLPTKGTKPVPGLWEHTWIAAWPPYPK